KRAGDSEEAAKRAAAKADQSRKVTESINHFYATHVLNEARPDRKGAKATILDSLDAAAAAVPTAFAADPRLRADVHSELGEILREIGQSAKAREQHRLALELKEKEYGPDHAETLVSLH